MVSYEEYCNAVQVIKQYKLQLETDLYKVTKEVNDIEKFTSLNSETKIGEVDCSVRLWGKMRDYFYHELGVGHGQMNHEIRVSDLSKISLSKFSKMRQAGKATIKELQELCFDAGITLQP